MSKKSDVLFDLNKTVSSVLTQMKQEFFKSKMELTFIARDPGDDETVVIISNDNLEDLSRLIEKYSKRPIYNSIKSGET